MAKADFCGGQIAYYNNGNFVATCNVPDHDVCILTKVGRVAKSMCGISPKGRPLGLMAGWMLRGMLCDDKEEHWQPDNFELPLSERKGARRALETAPGAEDLWQFEREDPNAEEGEPLNQW